MSTTNFFSSRQQKLIKAMQQSGFDTLVITPSPSLFYLTGLHFHIMERPVLALFTISMPPIMVIPQLEIRKTEGLSFPIQVFTYSDDPRTWGNVISEAFNQGSKARCVGIEPLHMRFLEFDYIRKAIPDAEILSAENLLSGLRIYKDNDEIKAMRKAVDAAQHALHTTLPLVKPGISEIDLAAELTIQLLRYGSQPEMAFSPIVSSGLNSANPHAMPTNRKLASGDLLVIDWGARVDGYISDLTRTFAIEKIDSELSHIAEIVKNANIAGRETASLGGTAGEIDKAARKVIDDAGYGEFFTHRTGHGIGLESHEEPYIRGDNSLVLCPGMTFTIEPGIYLPGRGGVRIEDNMLITSQGAECLSNLDRDLLILG
ncbi:MAG: aminopeptidase P family protein [Chloroflexi bacterium]|nr:aminopeptidase P family protein [Chloroflexota bacterium]